jgi:hypothetical protein
MRTANQPFDQRFQARADAGQAVYFSKKREQDFRAHTFVT